jgi:hypothetical protein
MIRWFLRLVDRWRGYHVPPRPFEVGDDKEARPD